MFEACPLKSTRQLEQLGPGYSPVRWTLTLEVRRKSKPKGTSLQTVLLL